MTQKENKKNWREEWKNRSQYYIIPKEIINDIESFIDYLLKKKNEEMVEKIKEINEYHTDIGGRNVVFTDDYIRKEDIINYLSPNKENKNNG